MKFTLILLSLLVTMVAHADPVDKTGARCARTLTYDFLMKPNGWLSASERSDLARGVQVTKYFMDPSGFVIGYVFKTAAFDAELVMAVYSRTDRHAGARGLGDFIVSSRIIDTDPNHPSNPFKAFYEQQVDLLANGRYTVVNKITEEDGGYAQNSTLIDSSDADFSPRWADGYFKVVPNGSNGSFVVACNYMVPRSAGWFRDKFNTISKERLALSGINLLNWVQRVSNSNAEANTLRMRLREMVGRH